MSLKKVDVLVIGGGPAGISAALSLSRTKRTVALYDSGLYRNENAVTFHTVPVHEAESPREWRTKAQEQLVARYPDTCELVKQRIVRLDKADGGFSATDASGGKVNAKKVILATGVEDKLTDVKGLLEIWGKQAIHCVYCHGTETAGQGVGVLLTKTPAINKLVLGSFMKKWRNLKNKPVYVLTNGQTQEEAGLDSGMCNAADKFGVKWETRSIAEVKTTSDSSPIELVFADGSESMSIPYIVTFAEQIRPSPHITEVLKSLEGDLGTAHPLFGMLLSQDNKDHAAPAMNPANPATLLKGVFWAGNTGSLIANVNLAIGSGQAAGVAADDEIAEEEMRQA